MRRLLAILAGVTVASGLLVAGTYRESQRKAREDVSECTPTPAEVAEHADLASRINLLPPEVIASPQFARIVGVDADGIRWVEDCIDDRRAWRWGPWNAWNPLERVEVQRYFAERTDGLVPWACETCLTARVP